MKNRRIFTTVYCMHCLSIKLKHWRGHIALPLRFTTSHCKKCNSNFELNLSFILQQYFVKYSIYLETKVANKIKYPKIQGDVVIV